MKHICLAAAVTAALQICLSACSGEQGRTELPVGVFDSGTGGLTVLERILTLDAFDNDSGEMVPDGHPDFEDESFEYLADQANMPYGVYDAQGKSDYLRRLVRDNASFLLGDRYFLSASEDRPGGVKKPCKIIVIACNTATAYGLEDVRGMLEDRGDGTRVIGVINAGVKAALDAMQGRTGAYAIGVMATPGTISSGAYERTILNEAGKRGLGATVSVVNQSGYGFAEAVDSDPDFVNPGLTSPRAAYRGPRIGTGDADIKPDLLDVYDFDPKGLLWHSGAALKTGIQLNSAANYARFNLVSLAERHRLSGNPAPIGAIILGCTHYPFELETLKECVAGLREFRKGDSYPYRDIFSEDLIFIDPAVYTAIECYQALREDGLLNTVSGSRMANAYISVPAASLDKSFLTGEGLLTFEYKYGRMSGDADTGTRIVPFSDDNIDAHNRARIKAMLPECGQLLL